MADKKLFRRNDKHSPSCTWDGKSRVLTMKVGNCRACDELKTTRMLGSKKGIFGIEAKEWHKYCKSNIEWAICTERTNPSCACNKPVLPRAL